MQGLNANDSNSRRGNPSKDGHKSRRSPTYNTQMTSSFCESNFKNGDTK